MSDSKTPRLPAQSSGAAALHPSVKAKAAAQQAAAAPASATAGSGGKPSAQMEAVMRLMAGKEERTIAEKLADSNRPTWEQYKKDNEDKLNISGLDQKKMEEYRKELDAQREKILARGRNHPELQKDGRDKDKDGKRKKKRKKKRSRHSSGDDSDIYSSDDSSRRQKRRKKHRKKHDRKKKKRSHRRHYSSESNESSESDSDGSRRRRPKKKKKKKRDKRDGKGGSGGSSDDDKAYRLSAFFEKGSDED